jgi:hypothetical protein
MEEIGKEEESCFKTIVIPQESRVLLVNKEDARNHFFISVRQE